MNHMLLLACLLLVAPSAAATSWAESNVTFLETNTAQIAVKGGMNGAEAAGLRAQVDREGNSDGLVLSQEVHDFTRAFSKDANNEGVAGTGSDFRLNGQPAASYRLLAFTLEHAEGPVTSTATIGVLADYELRFAKPCSHCILSTRPTDRSDPVMQGTTIQIPRTHTITIVSGLPEGATWNATAVHFSKDAKSAEGISIEYQEVLVAGRPAPATDAWPLAIVLVMLARRLHA